MVNLIRQRQAHRVFFQKYCSRFTRQLLIDDWVFKEDFPYPQQHYYFLGGQTWLPIPVVLAVFQPVLYT
ncbi:MAG: hypothetical protein F6K63_32640 [Moorea sp. SIO1G6]|uniref:hypothetical protein n=1 Tax=Moorena sp. SIO1G6 TaxID=2607840 RepID=UPI0013BEF023|nr:hypothetical protein [Moorena sp. SIO1G6]NEQ15242.1 hypothetical protein [Moorena sp. SIO3E2]NES41531.1 hypothetical protein [Moorena sp. SIO2C4]NET68888.1 hypothetical protein [Moorena sp. SIO1G6]